MASSPRRGHPVRIRKPNPKFEDEEDFRYSSPRAKKAQPTKISEMTRGLLSTPDKRTAQGIGVRLRNLLKLPKAHKWVCYEWFYSNLDKPLFLGENDFCICLKESFPELKTRKLRRAEWCKIRKLMGKPRRCSHAFFAEERAVLQQKREKIRALQQRKTADVPDLKDLPDEIPMPLVIGTKVTARLRKPQDGLFTGVIDALDTVNNTYRITFDRPGLGTHSINDCEVLSNEPQETIPLTAFQSRPRPQRLQPFQSPPRFIPGLVSPSLENDPILGGSPLMKGKPLQLDDGTYGGFPIKFLVLVTRLTKILEVKKKNVNELKSLNTEAEKMKSYGEQYPIHFQQKYASIVLELERLNKDLNEYLIGVQQFCQDLAPEQEKGFDASVDLKERCEDEAEDLVRKVNLQPGRKMVRNEKTMDMISKLISLLLQVKTYSENNLKPFEFKSLQSTLDEIRSSIDPTNLQSFESNVQIHINHIQSGLTQMGNLSAFQSTASNPGALVESSMNL